MSERRGVFSITDYNDRSIENKTDTLNDVWIVSDAGQPYRYGENRNDFKMLPPDGAGYDWGDAIAIGSNPNLIVIGAPKYDVGSIIDVGSAYIYDLNGKKISSRLTIAEASTGDANTNFGQAIAIGEGRIFIGRDDEIRIYNSPWTDGIPDVTLTPGANTGQGYGTVLAVGSGRLVVGNPLYSNKAGRIIIYELDPTSGTIEDSAIFGPSASSGSRSYYGISVAVGENLIVAGAGGVAPGGDYISGGGYAEILDLDGTVLHTLNADIALGEARVAYFGNSVAIGNGKVAVGAPNYGRTDSISRIFMGAVYVFDQDGTNRIKITASNGRIGDRFGSKVEIKNNKLIVSAPRRDHEYLQSSTEFTEGANKGSVYIYNLDGTGEYEIKYPGPEDFAGVEFGRHISATDDRLLVSATNKYFTANDIIYCYDFNGIIANTNRVVPTNIDERRDEIGLRDIQNQIRSFDGSTDDFFGYSVAAGSNKIVVGAWGEDQLNFNSQSGAAYVYNLDGTGEIKITQPSTQDTDIFGWAVAVGDNKMTISERNDEVVHIYDLDGSNRVTIEDPSGFSGDYFGHAVAIGSNKVFVGSIGVNAFVDGSSYIDAGRVTVFNLDGTYDFLIQPSDASSVNYNYRQFGQAIAVKDGKVAIGSNVNSSFGNSLGGKVHIYDVDGSNEVIISNGTTGFGRAVALGYNKVFVGAKNSDRVFIYNLDGTFVKSISVFDKKGTYSDFGTSVAVGNNKIFVGAPLDNYNDGAFYVFNLDGTGGYKITPHNIDDYNVGGDKFIGQSIAVEGNKVIVGAYEDGNFEYQVHAGSVYTYNIDDLDQYHNARNRLI